jgi:hypothetical protein
MNRKLTALSFVLLVLIGVGAYLWLFAKPSTPKENPLKSADLSKVSRLIIRNHAGVAGALVTNRLEKQNGVWNVIEPVADVADPEIPPAILASLKDFALGSIVSDNPSRYAEFQLDPAHAAEVYVYVEGQDKPLLSGFVGKTAGDYGSCYFRFAVSSGPVYNTTGLQQYQFFRDPMSFRSPVVIPSMAEEPTHLILTHGKKIWDLTRSSATWTTSAGKKVDDTLIKPLLKILFDLRSDAFGNGTETPAQLGLDAPASPYLTLNVGAKDGSHVLTVGKLAPKSVPVAAATRYARVSGRSSVLLVQDAQLTQLLDSFSKLPK